MRENKMGTTPVLKLIFTMSLPAMFSMLVQAMYNVVDSMFVAQIGENALTALSLAFPVQTLMIAVAVGTAVGINSLVARRLGENRRDEASSAATHGLMLSFVSSLLFVVLGAVLARPFFEAFTDNQTVVQMGYDYLFIVMVFCSASFVQIAMEKTLQATGNMIYPMFFQLTGAITNIILDPIMIFGLLGFPALGVRGAAVATVTGQVASMLLSLYVVFTQNHEVHITFKGFRLRWRMIRDIYAVGLPAIVMQAIMSVLVSGLNAILIAFSEAAVAVLGVYYKLQSFIFMPVFGLTQGVMPIMGYNYGAGNKKRLLDALRFGIMIAATILLCGMLLFWIIPDRLLMIFNASPQMLEVGIPALRTISLSFVPAALGILYSTLFQAVGKGGFSLIVSILRQLVIILPAAYLLSRLGLAYTWYSFPIAEVFSFIVSIVLFQRLYRQRIQHLTPLRSETTQQPAL